MGGIEFIQATGLSLAPGKQQGKGRNVSLQECLLLIPHFQAEEEEEEEEERQVTVDHLNDADLAFFLAVLASFLVFITR